MFKIAQIEPMVISAPLANPVRMSGITIASADNLVVRVTDGEGSAGWGEAASAPLMTGETPDGMAAAAHFMARRLTGREIETADSVFALVDSTMHGNHGAKAAIEIAVLDLLGRRTGLPLSALLGERARERVPVLTLIAEGTPGADAAQAVRAANDGCRAFKVKVALTELAMDIARCEAVCEAVRKAVGAAARVSADANQGFSPNDALDFVSAAGEIGLDFVEQPVRGDDLDGMRACAEASAVPIGVDEGLHSIDDIIRHHQHGAAAGGSLKTIKLGGVVPVMAAARLMHGLDMRVNLAGKVAETSIAGAALVHLAACLPQLDWDLSLSNRYLAADVVDEPVTITDGCVSASERPGIGVTVDETSIGRLRRKYQEIRG